VPRAQTADASCFKRTRGRWKPLESADGSSSSYQRSFAGHADKTIAIYLKTRCRAPEIARFETGFLVLFVGASCT